MKHRIFAFGILLVFTSIMAMKAPEAATLTHGQELMRAVIFNDLIEVQKLLQNENIDINWKDYRPEGKGNTPLTEAAMYSKPEIVELLLKAHANPNLQNNEGYTAIMLAIQHNRPQIVELLLRFNADTNKTNIYGQSTLKLASYNDKIFKIVAEARRLQRLYGPVKWKEYWQQGQSNEK